MRLSVIVPTCDRPLIIERALRSVIEQELPVSEIIVVDDGRTGQMAITEMTLRELRSKSLARIHLVDRRRPSGPGGARNDGAEYARGEVLAFLDDDDEWAPSYLRKVIAHREATGANVVCTDLDLRWEIERPQNIKPAAERLVVEDFLTRNAGLIGSNLVIDRELFFAVGGFDASMPALEDMDFAIRLASHGDVRYAPLHEPLVRHHHHHMPRLCTRRGIAMRAGIRRFYEVHHQRMTAEQREEFRANVIRLWGVDEHGEDITTPPAES